MFVYLITNLHNQKRYVGITRRTIKQRWKEHCNAAFSKRKRLNYPLYFALRKHGKSAFIIASLCECDSWEELCYFERQFIQELQTHISTGLGYNMTLGGEGVVHDEISKLAISQAHRGHVCSEKTRKRISCALKGKFAGSKHPLFQKGHSVKTRQKMSQVRAGKSQPWHNVRVEQFGLDDVSIRVYDSMRQAATITGIKASGISCCCRGVTKTAGGFRWKYVQS